MATGKDTHVTTAKATTVTSTKDNDKSTSDTPDTSTQDNREQERRNQEEAERLSREDKAQKSDVLGATEEQPDATHVLVLADGTKVNSVGLVSTIHNGVPVVASYEKKD